MEIKQEMKARDMPRVTSFDIISNILGMVSFYVHSSKRLLTEIDVLKKLSLGNILYLQYFGVQGGRAENKVNTNV